MNKYNVGLDMYSKNSLSLIIDMMDSNSKVLEFGSANGRMTKYLKEEMNCIVDIVELDEEAGKDASKYANIALVGKEDGNIENYKWEQLLKNNRYDYIIFADVLEHLYDPETVLKKSKRFLKHNGCILISIPNVAHNSVIVDLINDKFTYTEVGLLDNTHIRFFTYDSLKNMIDRCGLVTTVEQATYETLFEASRAYESVENTYLIDILKNRETGNVFQFIFKLQDKNYYQESNPTRFINIDGRLGDEAVFYFKEKEYDHYDEKRSIRKKVSSCKMNVINIGVTNFYGSSYVRFDPCEKKCVVKLNRVTSFCDGDNRKIQINDMRDNATNRVGTYYYFNMDDPQFEFKLPNKTKKLEIDFQIYKIYDEDILTEFLESEKSKLKLKEELQNKYREQELEKEELQNKYREQELEKEELQNKYKEQEIENLNMINYINYKNSEVDYIKSTFSWRLTLPLRKLKEIIILPLRFTKRQLIYKTLKSLKNNGLKDTIKKTKNYLEKSRKNKVINIKPSPDEYIKSETSDYSFQENESFKDKKTDIKTVCFFLPQFHEIPENNEWWGKGFTEWCNTKKATPKFEGHYQPRIPNRDIGYYDLSNITTLKKQVKLAKEHGIYGFCFYYYWFSGKRLLEKPVDMLLKNKDIDINFCLCWANENWTRTWDGQKNNILMKQYYSDEDDEQFMIDMKKYIDDSRYIRIAGKPLVLVYNPGEIPNCKKTFDTWRKSAKKIGIGEVLIFTCQTANNTAEKLKISEYVDGEVEFPPHNVWFESIGIRNIDLKGREASIYNYSKLVDVLKNINKNNSKNNVYPCCMMAWDNSARRENNFVVFHLYLIKKFYEWLCSSVERLRQNYDKQERFLFINAWNEWAEGTYLEPDEKYGYANINTLSKAIFDLPLKDEPLIFSNKNIAEKEYRVIGKIAIQIHVFYLELLDEIILELNKIPFEFDCFISTDTMLKKNTIEKKIKSVKKCGQIIVEILENKGRDVLPFIEQLKSICGNYTYVCHIHTKKTENSNYGESWRKYLFKHILGNTENILNIMFTFEKNTNIGLIFPETYPLLLKQAEWGGNKKSCEQLIHIIQSDYQLPNDPVFPVGNMFWARTAAIKRILDCGIDENDFPNENGQLNATLAHVIERLWVYVASVSGYSYKKIFNNYYDKPKKLRKIKRLTVFVHYDKENLISKQDIYLLKELRHISDETFFISNNLLSEIELYKIKELVSYIKTRKNIGFDFSAWKYAIEKLGYENLNKFDEIILVNNSILGPFIDLEYVFAQMNSKDVDFWGITLFPFLEDGSYIKREHIKEHIQSYFQVFKRNVFMSEAFKKFWTNVKDYDNIIDVIANEETELTDTLKKSGFRYDVLISESKYLYSTLNSGSVPYEYPVELLQLGIPFIKKKALNIDDFGEKNRILYWINNLL